MAQKESKYPQNSPGPFYVDDQCIACDACVVEAPNFFRMNDLVGHAFVFKQPKTEKEIEMCENALEACPVNAIGRDGEN
jgi:ferredoxin